MIDKTLDTSWDTALSKFVACLYLESVRVTNKVGERGGILLGRGIRILDTAIFDQHVVLSPSNA